MGPQSGIQATLCRATVVRPCSRFARRLLNVVPAVGRKDGQGRRPWPPAFPFAWGAELGSPEIMPYSAHRRKPLIEQLDGDFLRNISLESESDKPRRSFVSVHRPADESRPALAITVRKVAMTWRELLALRSHPRCVRFPLGAIGNVKADISIVKGPAPTVAVAGAHFLRQALMTGYAPSDIVGDPLREVPSLGDRNGWGDTAGQARPPFFYAPGVFAIGSSFLNSCSTTR